jgi:dTMP kinase
MSRSGRAPSGAWFITIEGPDGGGKTTQAERLVAHLAAVGHPSILTREPGGTWLGERLRDVLLARTDVGAAPTDPMTDALLFNAARRQLVRDVIRPGLASGMTVICARFADSTLAYQGFGGGAPLDRLTALAAIATDGLVPDLTIVLDLPVDVGLARKAPADITRFEAEFDLAFHSRVRNGFLALAAADPGRFVVIDATMDVDAVAAVVRATVDGRLGASEPARDAVRISR